MNRLSPLLALLFPLGAQAALPSHPRPVAIEGEVIVKLRPAGATLAKAQRLALGMASKRSLPAQSIEVLQLPAMMPAAKAIELLQAMPDVEYAEPNFLRFRYAATPSDPLFGIQWGLLNTGQPNFVTGGPAGTPGADLNMPQAWDANGDGVADRVGDPSVRVAVIDDAFDTAHEDLAANFLLGSDFGQGDNNPNPDIADQLHGTAVAGCVAAVGNNGIGIAGPAWNVRMIPLKISRLETEDGATTAVLSLDAALEAYEAARTRGARIVNASYGGPSFSQAERDAIRGMTADDILFVAAAGNDDSNTDLGQITYPANHDAENILAVAATNRQDSIASFSQYGPTTVDVAAPGLQIVTTLPGNAYANTGLSGTSFAAPYAAGIAALIKSHVTGATWRDLKARLVESGENGDETQLRTIGGRIDADAALELSPRPSLVIRRIEIEDGGNGVLDPGENATLAITLRNQWTAATAITAQLSSVAGPGGVVVTVPAAPAVVGNLAANAQTTVRFDIGVPGGISNHRYVYFQLALAANAGGYQTQRGFILEVGRLTEGAAASQSFAPRDDNLYDEFHAWHFDLATRAPALTFSTTAAADIDILVKRATPPQYNITVGVDPESSDGFFCTSGTTADCLDPMTFIGGGADGNETVTIADAQPGTYHVVVVNFAQRPEGLGYTLEAEVSQTPPPAAGGGGGGGPLAPAALLVLGLAAWRRKSP